MWSEEAATNIIISQSGYSCLVSLRKHSEISVNTKMDLRQILRLYYYQTFIWAQPADKKLKPYDIKELH